MNAVIDEDLPRSFASVLISLGFTPYDVRDHGLRGQNDAKVYEFAQKQKAVLFSADLGFANIVDFPLECHFGICILRFPNFMPVNLINDSVFKLMSSIEIKDYHGNLIILSPGKVRIRRYLHRDN